VLTGLGGSAGQYHASAPKDSAMGFNEADRIGRILLPGLDVLETFDLGNVARRKVKLWSSEGSCNTVESVAW